MYAFPMENIRKIERPEGIYTTYSFSYLVEIEKAIERFINWTRQSYEHEGLEEARDCLSFVRLIMTLMRVTGKATHRIGPNRDLMTYFERQGFLFDGMTFEREENLFPV